MTESGRIFEAALAQLAERKTEDLEVAGSTPAGGIVFFLFFYLIIILNMKKLPKSHSNK